jgi:hypothetical protein
VLPGAALDSSRIVVVWGKQGDMSRWNLSAAYPSWITGLGFGWP